MQLDRFPQFIINLVFVKNYILNLSQTVHAVKSDSGNTCIFDYCYLHQERCPVVIPSLTDFLFVNGKIKRLQDRGKKPKKTYPTPTITELKLYLLRKKSNHRVGELL